jgi:hypothetical protein
MLRGDTSASITQIRKSDCPQRSWGRKWIVDKALMSANGRKWANPCHGIKGLRGGSPERHTGMEYDKKSENWQVQTTRCPTP